ncbi:SAP domain-containing protein [Streptomyces sp. PA03-6a]|nr:SAP domain-containing protein [Streptomyces sp. PA03-6a]
MRVNEATQPQEEEQEMAKVTLHGGPSNDAANAEASEHAPAEASPEAPAESGYEDWTVEQLKDQLTERGLPKSGKRDDLVQRLRDDDAQDTE